MVNDFILPAMKALPRPIATDATRQALTRELELSAHVAGVPGTDLAFNDAPQK
jgi:hypothetical protein